MAEVTVRTAMRTMLAGVMVAAAATAAPAAAQQRPAATVAAPAVPSVRAGVDLWRAGDWAGAVAIWQPFAVQGDADAMFNMGQAYKLGRAVTLDKAVARDWYRKAALKNHLPAAANLGILLFQAGEKPEAARWLKTAADRGEMRAQYVLGVAHWNGDGVAKSLPLAYAYLARASAQGLSEASAALGNLNRAISPAERANGETVATSLAAGNGVPAVMAARTTPTTTAELNRMNMETVQRPAPVAAPAARPPATAPADRPVATPPVAVASVPRPVAVASAVAAPPAERPPAPAVEKVEIPASTPAVVAAVKPAEPPKPVAEKPVARPAAKPAPKPAPTPPGWRVQLGAFGSRAQAETAWTEFKTRQKAAVGTAKPIYEPGTAITKLQMGPYKTRAEAKDACAKIAFGGRACFVTEAAGK